MEDKCDKVIERSLTDILYLHALGNFAISSPNFVDMKFETI